LAELERAVCERFGDKGMELIQELWRKGAADFLSYFKLAQEIMGYDIKLIEATDKKPS